MFLKEFAIRRYGPLPDSGRRKPGLFNLFYGPNEEGKTLTIDAILKMLFGKSAARFFEAVKRVEESPDGYLILEDGKKKVYKLPESGTLPDLTGLSLNEFSNIFIIRDSDLSISDEGLFYRNLTARLTGMRGNEISRIKEELQRLGSVTQTGEYQNIAPSKLKEKVRKAQQLVERIEPFIEELQQEKFGHFEEELARLEQERAEISAKLDRYRSARTRELYETGRSALGRLEDAGKALQSLQGYSEESFEQWQRAEVSMQYLGNEKENLLAEIEEKKKLLVAAQNNKQEKTVYTRNVEKKARAAEEKLEPLLADYDRLHHQWIKIEALKANRFLNRASLAALLLLIISLGGLIFRPAWWFVASAALLATALLLYTAYRLKKSLARGTLQAAEARALAAAADYGLADTDLRAVRKELEKLKIEAELASENVHEAEREINWQQKELNDLNERLAEKERLARDHEETIGRIRRELALESLEDYTLLLKRRQDLESEIKSQGGILESHFNHGSVPAPYPNRLAAWREKVEALGAYALECPGLRYDQEEVKRLNLSLAEAEKAGEILRGKMKGRLEDLRDLEKQANELLNFGGEDYLPCQTILDLTVIGQRVREWLDQQESNREAAVIALDIFSALEADEEQKVTALFGPDSPVSAYFSRITGGLYKEVIFESRDNPIRVMRSDGIELDASRLSGGAYDQLYFAIRLALADKVLDGEKGFFIFDDPFIKADPVRLAAQLEMLFDISAAGWQILYFSAKGEVKEALRGKIKSGKVKQLSIATA